MFLGGTYWYHTYYGKSCKFLIFDFSPSLSPLGRKYLKLLSTVANVMSNNVSPQPKNSSQVFTVRHRFSEILYRSYGMNQISFKFHGIIHNRNLDEIYGVPTYGPVDPNEILETIPQ